MDEHQGSDQAVEKAAQKDEIQLDAATSSTSSSTLTSQHQRKHEDSNTTTTNQPNLPTPSATSNSTSSSTSTPPYTKQTKSQKKKLAEGTRFFRHYIHCCCRHNDIASAFVVYEIAMHVIRSFAPNTAAENVLNEDLAELMHLIPTFKNDTLFKIESPLFSSLLSLCDGVSPSDYLQSGASNVATSASASSSSSSAKTKTPNDSSSSKVDEDKVTDSYSNSHKWTPEIMSVYRVARGVAYKRHGSSSSLSPSPSPSSSDPTQTNPTPPLSNPPDQSRFTLALTLKSDMTYLKYTFNEIAYTALIRMSVRANSLGTAESTLAVAEGDNGIKKRNRLFLDVLRMYCTSASLVERSLTKALDVWRRLLTFDLSLNEIEYCLLLQCATYFKDEVVAEMVLNDLKEDVLVPLSETRDAILGWYTSIGATNENENESRTSETWNNSGLTSVTPSIGNIVSKTGWTINDPLTVDDAGIFLSLPSECKLKSIEITTQRCHELVKMNDEIVRSGSATGHTSNYLGGGKGSKTNGKYNQSLHLQESKVRQWDEFGVYLEKRYLDRASGGMFDIVIDGANVGYFQQNYQGHSTSVSYAQIDDVVNHFARRGGKVLLVMHSRHFTPQMVGSGSNSTIVQNWVDGGILYKTPMGMNDDWFWLKASLYAGMKQHIDGINDKRAVELPFFISNDELRDHNYQMLQAREMMRWKERKAVNFLFGDWESRDKITNELISVTGYKSGVVSYASLGEGDRESGGGGSGGGDSERGKHARKSCVKRREVVLVYPAKYSRRIQEREDGRGVYIPVEGVGREMVWVGVVERTEEAREGGKKRRRSEEKEEEE